MNDKVKMIANLLDDKHAQDIEVYEVGKMHPLFDTVIVGSVDVKRNLDTIVNEIKKFEKEGQLSVRNYDTKSPEWVLIDFDDVLVHIFIKDQRSFYDVEGILKAYVDQNND